GVDEVEVQRGCLGEERLTVGEMERDARVVPEMAPSHLQHLGVVFDRVEPGTLVHAGEEPSRTDASTGPEFQKSAARLGCGEGAKQRAGLRLRSHCEPQLPGVAANRIDHCRNLPDFKIIHLENVLYPLTAHVA